MRTLGFVGTAKNTGKTTAAVHVLELVRAAGLTTALTSIGFDGESTDHITGLPKPRYQAAPGMLVATADSLLDYGSADFDRTEPTGLQTILGEIVIARVSRPGTVALAGPNRRLDLRRLLDRLAAVQVDLTLVDGALNRLAALSLADGLVLSTGAAFDERIEVIAAHAAAMESLFHLPRSSDWTENAPSLVCLRQENGRLIQLSTSSVLDEGSLSSLLSQLTPGADAACFIPGVFSPTLFQTMVQKFPDRVAGKRFTFTSPVHLLASGKPEIWQSALETLSAAGGAAGYQAALPLCFLTVNPFFPRYLQKTGAYVAEYVDKQQLLHSVQARITRTPVVDILQPPHPDLLALCQITPKN